MLKASELIPVSSANFQSHNQHFTARKEPKFITVIAYTVYVDVLRDAWPPPELLVEISDAA